MSLCWLQACREFLNVVDGVKECVLQCPPRTKYDRDTYTYVHNPDGKYFYGSLCVDECPGESGIINLRQKDGIRASEGLIRGFWGGDFNYK